VERVDHGERRVDEYAWLRDKDDPAVAAYLQAENAWTATVLAPLEGLRQVLYDEMFARIPTGDTGTTSGPRRTTSTRSTAAAPARWTARRRSSWTST
jgi:protease II